MLVFSEGPSNSSWNVSVQVALAGEDSTHINPSTNKVLVQVRVRIARLGAVKSAPQQTLYPAGSTSLGWGI